MEKVRKIFIYICFSCLPFIGIFIGGFLPATCMERARYGKCFVTEVEKQKIYDNEKIEELNNIKNETETKKYKAGCVGYKGSLEIIEIGDINER
jgi:hypothetical protein